MIEVYERLVTKMLEENIELFKKQKIDDCYTTASFEKIKDNLLSLDEETIKKNKENNRYWDMFWNVVGMIAVTGLLTIFMGVCYKVFSLIVS